MPAGGLGAIMSWTPRLPVDAFRQILSRAMPPWKKKNLHCRSSKSRCICEYIPGTKRDVFWPSKENLLRMAAVVGWAACKLPRCLNQIYSKPLGFAKYLIHAISYIGTFPHEVGTERMWTSGGLGVIEDDEFIAFLKVPPCPFGASLCMEFRSGVKHPFYLV